MAVIEISDKNIDEVIKEGKVLVDCYATWCGPCRMLAPVIEEIEKERSDIKFYKLDVDNNPDTSIKYGIMSIPTLLLFENGELKNQSVGFKDKNELQELLK